MRGTRRVRIRVPDRHRRTRFFRTKRRYDRASVHRPRLSRFGNLLHAAQRLFSRSGNRRHVLPVRLAYRCRHSRIVHRRRSGYRHQRGHDRFYRRRAPAGSMPAALHHISESTRSRSGGIAVRSEFRHHAVGISDERPASAQPGVLRAHPRRHRAVRIRR